jgi:GntR family transcriptional regulator
MKLDPGPLPLYHQLEENLRARIHGDEFAPGAVLPTEEQICAEYGVSRITVRRALDALIAQGLIVRRRGVGSFVAEPKSGVRSVRLVGSLDEFLAASGALETQMVSLGETVAPAEIVELLQVENGATVVCLEAITRLDGAPIGYLNIYFPLEVGRLFDPADIDSQVPVIRTMERKLNTRVVRAEQVIEADNAGDAAALHLGIDRQSPVLRVTRVYFTAFERPIEVALIRYHPERYRYSIDFHSKGARR